MITLWSDLALIPFLFLLPLAFMYPQEYLDCLKLKGGLYTSNKSDIFLTIWTAFAIAGAIYFLWGLI